MIKNITIDIIIFNNYSKQVITLYLFSRTVIFTLLFFQSLLLAEPAIKNFEMPESVKPAYKAPTERFVELYNYEIILQTLRDKGMSLEHRNFFEHIISHEELGFFGYHSSTQGFRIFQDIIRLVLEEVCGLDIKPDFHFLRIPGGALLNRQDAKQFLKDYPSVSDHQEDQKEQLLSMNYTLFGNFNNFGECSIYYFTANRSASSVVFQAKLRVLFDLLGLPLEVIPELFAIGHPLANSENAVLFQFFDFSHYNAFQLPYALVDQMCYASFPIGIPEGTSKRMSQHYLGTESSAFTRQFRLVINNSHILNPYGALFIKRYERTDPEVVKKYEVQLREVIRKLSFDPAKAKQYRNLLLKLWGQTNDSL